MILIILLSIVVLTVIIFCSYISLKYIRIVTDNILNVPFPLDHAHTNTIESQDVEFPSFDGTKFHGKFISSPNGSKKTIIFCHEYGSDQNSWAKYLSYIPENGFNVFTFDFRKASDDGKLHKKGFSPKQWSTKKELRDLLAAIEYLQKRNDVDANDLGIFGVSKGGGLAICAAAKSKRITAVISDGALPVVETIKDYINKWANIYMPDLIFRNLPGPLIHLLAYLSVRLASLRLRSRIILVEKRIRSSHQPLFLIHGASDNYVRPQHAQYLFDRSKSKKELWIVPDAAHNDSVLSDPKQYEERVLAFFQKHIKG